MENNENLLTNELSIDAIAHTHLYESAKWGVFLAILGFIFSGLFAIIALFSSSIYGAATLGFGNSSSAMGTTVIMVVYLLIALINFFLSLYLYRFSTKMKTALQALDQGALNDSFLNLKNMFKMMGIIAIIYLGFLVLALLIGVGSLVMG